LRELVEVRRKMVAANTQGIKSFFSGLDQKQLKRTVARPNDNSFQSRLA